MCLLLMGSHAHSWSSSTGEGTRGPRCLFTAPNGVLVPAGGQQRQGQEDSAPLPAQQSRCTYPQEMLPLTRILM